MLLLESNTLICFRKSNSTSVVGLDNLKSFSLQNIANIVWAYATANELRPDLFEKIAIDVASRRKFLAFNGQDLANIAWHDCHTVLCTSSIHSTCPELSN
jgi:hypothetical protein